MKVLLVDTALAAVPIYDYLVQEGHDVWVIGNREGDILARRAGSRWIQQDYRNYLEVEKHIEALHIERVVPGCTDVSLETCSRLKVSSSYADSPEINRKISNKLEFRRLCEELSMPAPLVVAKESFPLCGRFICKPVDAFSGRGVTIFDGGDQSAMVAAYQAAIEVSPSAGAIFETFAEGPLYSCSAFVENGKLTNSFYVREGSSAYEFAVDTSYIDHAVPERHMVTLEKSLEKLCGFLNLKDGLLHTQFILNESGPWIIELTRRCPGDLYSLLIEYSTGFKYAAKYASYFVGTQLITQSFEQRHVLRHTVSSVDTLIFCGIKFSPPVNVRAFFPLQTIGQILTGRQGTRAGILFCEQHSHDLLVEGYKSLLDRDIYTLS
ncbi:MAG: ATP-grasp domain-containing protein [Bdellovibrionales bacterium]|nr:ATP-grasp domain-containing protein [Bdellovibrionales bacterium]